MTSWLKLYPGVPEYGRYHDTDLDLLIDWFYEFDEHTTEQREYFVRWLHSLPIGVVKPVPNHDGYSIVKVNYEGPNHVAERFDS